MPDATTEPTDAEILALLRPVIALTRERDRHAEVVDRLRQATTPAELAERDTAGRRMAELDEEICYDSVSALHQVGLWHAAMAVSLMLDEAAAEDDEDVDDEETEPAWAD